MYTDMLASFDCFVSITIIWSVKCDVVDVFKYLVLSDQPSHTERFSVTHHMRLRKPTSVHILEAAVVMFVGCPSEEAILVVSFDSNVLYDKK